ncbi:hypothetical protein B0H14DRAFT_2775684 [Mycena olivaceomarginata]|nr:hypothetical protein B0H14DRAFT_2775684 [Mycena olivaceomarginata]
MGCNYRLSVRLSQGSSFLRSCVPRICSPGSDTPISHHRAVSAIQLSSILAHSPHLIRYICDLTIGQCDTETLAPIIEVAWSHVFAIALVHLDESLAPALDLIGIFVSLPSLRKITFQSNAWEAAHLRAVLANCNPNVHGLAFHSCSPEMTNTLTDGNPRLILSTRPTVTHLDLFFADTIPDFLLAAACPVGLSQLTHVKFGWCSGTGLSSFLVVFAQTIQSIDVDASGHLRTVDLGCFPRLSHISVRGKGSALQYALEHSRESNVHTICYRAAAWRGVSGLWSVQAAILSAKMPALRRVDVKVVMDRNNTFSTEQWISRVKDSMPLLDARGILAITFD